MTSWRLFELLRSEDHRAAALMVVLAAFAAPCYWLAAAEPPFGFYTPEAAPPFGGSVVTHAELSEKQEPPKPGYLESYVDPFYGSKVTRISGDPGAPIPNVGGAWPAMCRNHYSKSPAWNADGSLMVLPKCDNLFLDGVTYEPLFRASPGGVGTWRARWHPSEPDVMYYVTGATLGKWNVKSRKSTVVLRLPGYDGFTFSESNLSGNGDWVALAANDPRGKRVAVVYNIRHAKRYADIPIEGELDWASISYSGKYVVICGNVGCDDERADFLAIYETLTGRRIDKRLCAYGAPSHADMTIDDNGDDVIVGVAKDTPARSRSRESWTQWHDCVMRRLKDDTYTRLGRAASHTTTRSYLRPGWAYAWDAFRDYEGEVLAYQCKRGGVVERLAYIPSITTNYDSENHGVPSPDGKKFCVPSNWGETNGPIQTYVVDVSPLVE